MNEKGIRIDCDEVFNSAWIGRLRHEVGVPRLSRDLSSWAKWLVGEGRGWEYC